MLRLEMGIRKRGDKWLVTAESGRDEFGVRWRVCRSVDTEDEAKRLDARLQHEVCEGRHIKPSSKSVAAFCQRFLDGRDKIAPATRSRYQAYLKHVKRDLGAVPLSRFTPRIATSWKKKQLACDLSASTVRKHLAFVYAAINAAVAQHLIAENPMDHVELPDDEPPPFHAYTPSEQAALLAAAAPGDGEMEGRHKGRSEGSLYVPVVLDLATGLRRGEPLYLREALAAHGVEADHMRIWQTVGKLRRRHGLVMSGEPREPGYRVEDWTWEARRVRSSVKGG